MDQSENSAVGTDPLYRYSRQLVLPGIGRSGQEKLLKSSVLVVGCGALGSAQSEMLARAGVGKLIIADRDVLELHNLQRQLLFDEDDVAARTPKAPAAAKRLRKINSGIEIADLVADVTSLNVEKIIAGADVVLDGTDNFETRYLLNDVCVKAGKPWVYGGVLGSEGMVMAVRPGRTACLRCVFPDPPDSTSQPTCETNGVLNTVVAVVAAWQSTEILKLLLGHPDAGGVLRSFDPWKGIANAISVSREEECPCCGHRDFEFLAAKRGSSATVFCGRNAVQVSPSEETALDLERLAGRLGEVGKVAFSGMLLEFETEGKRLVIFPDGRVLVMGCTDKAVARSLVARYVGG
jgi:adenylyltransferase/sulfurtransferase